MFNKYKIATFIFVCFFLSSNTYAQDFKTVSRGLAFIEFTNGNSGLSAIIEQDGKTYAVTTQSLFLAMGTKFDLKDFKGNKLEFTSMSICPDGDLIRFEIRKNDYIKPLKIDGRVKTLYVIAPKEGTVSSKPFSDKDLTFPGFIVLSGNGGLAGFSSVSKGYSGKSVSLIKIEKDDKWNELGTRSFNSQINELRDMKAKTISIKALMDLNKKNSYFEYFPIHHPTHFAWIEDRNIQYETFVFSTFKHGKSMGVAKFNHEARCSHYDGLRRLSSFAFNIARIVEKTEWLSPFLKDSASALGQKASEMNNSLKLEMEELLEEHPATKTKI